MTRSQWCEYSKIGVALAGNLEEQWETPDEFVTECRIIHDYENPSHTNLPLYAKLRPDLLEQIDGIDYKRSRHVIDQIVRDIKNSR